MAERPRRTGRRPKWSPGLQEGLCNVLALGGTRRAACARVGITPDTFYHWLERYQTFSDAVDRAEADAELRYLTPVARAANDGDWRAGIAWLERRRRQDWALSVEVGESVIDLAAILTRAFSQPVAHSPTVEAQVRELTDEELSKLPPPTPRNGTNGVNGR